MGIKQYYFIDDRGNYQNTATSDLDMQTKIEKHFKEQTVLCVVVGKTIESKVTKKNISAVVGKKQVLVERDFVTLTKSLDLSDIVVEKEIVVEKRSPR